MLVNFISIHMTQRGGRYNKRLICFHGKNVFYELIFVYVQSNLIGLIE